MLKPGLPKLVATDLDGTLVRSDDTVSAYTHEVLDRVRAAGIRVVGATGRGPRLTSLTRTDIRDADFLVLAGIVVVVSYLVYGGYIFLAERSRRLLASSKASRIWASAMRLVSCSRTVARCRPARCARCR